MASMAYPTRMTVSRRLQFVRVLVAWTLGVLVTLTVLDLLDLELFFSSVLVGLLVALEVTASVNVSPRWRTPLRWLAVVGFVIFGLIVIRRMVAMLPPGVL